MIHAGSWPSSRSDVRDHRCGGRLAVRAADDDRAAERDELGEELGARAPLDATGVRRRHDHLRFRGRRRLTADVHIDAGERTRGRSCRARPTLRPPLPRRARSSRTRRARRRRYRRSRSAALRAEARLTGRPSASATSSSATTSAASGLARARIASLICASRAVLPSSSSTSAGTRASSLWSTTTAPPPASKCRAFSVWWSAVACGYGTRIAGVPAAASSHTVPPAREIARSAAASAAPKSSVDSRRT